MSGLIHWLLVGLFVYALILVLAFPLITNTRFPFCKTEKR